MQIELLFNQSSEQPIMVRPIPVQLRQEQLQRPLTLFFDDTYTRAIRSNDSNVDYSSHDNNKPSSTSAKSSTNSAGSAARSIGGNSRRRSSAPATLLSGTVDQARGGKDGLMLNSKKTKKGLFSTLRFSSSKNRKMQTLKEDPALEQKTV